MTKTINNNEGYIRLKDILKILPVSKSYFYRMVRDGAYPSGIMITSRTRAWKKSDIYKLLEDVELQNFKVSRNTIDYIF